MKDTAKSVGFESRGMHTHKDDYVGEGLGGNRGADKQASFLDKFKIDNIAKLFGKKSPHSTYGCSENKKAECGDKQ